MQVIWSRAAPTRTSCRCRGCFRRSTTAVSKRRLKIGDLFTACYSTILGTAVFADARVKEDRRKEWDRVIAEAKAGLSKDAPIEPSETGQIHAENQPSAVGTALGDVKSWKASAVWDEASTTRSTSLHPADISLDSFLKQTILQDANHQESSLVEVDEDWVDEAAEPRASCESTVDCFQPREPTIRLHVDKMEEMVSKLVNRLLPPRREISASMDRMCESDVSSRLKEILDRIESQQHIARVPSFRTTEQRWQLNNSIEMLLKKIAADRFNIDLIVAKICYNLLVSASPPDIQTYNTMIRSFDRLKMYQLSQIVVDSFLHESKFRPNSETIQLLLDHYSGQKDKAGFRAMVDRMRVVNKCMYIGVRPADTIDRKDVQEWAIARKVAHKGAHLREKVTRDSGIFDSLVNGFLELDMLRAAVRYLRAALREGIEVSSKTLLRLVQACTSDLDYKSGMSILRLLLKYWKKNSEQIVYDGPARLAVHQLLGLCGIEPSSTEAQLVPLRVSHEALQGLQRRMAIQSLEDAMAHHAAQIAKVLALLGCSQGSAIQVLTMPSKHDIKQALGVLHALSNHERLRSLRRNANNNQCRILKHEATTAEVKKDWLMAQYCKLQTEWRKRYDKIVTRFPDLRWSDRLEILSHFREGEDLPPEHRLYAATSKSHDFLRRRKNNEFILFKFQLRKENRVESKVASQLERQNEGSHRREQAPSIPQSWSLISPTLYIPTVPTEHNAVIEARAA